MNTQQATEEQTPPFSLADLRTILGLIAENPTVLNERTLRFQLRHRKETGLARYCVKVGKNILISKTGYERWLVERAHQEAC